MSKSSAKNFRALLENIGDSFGVIGLRLAGLFFVHRADFLRVSAFKAEKIVGVGVLFVVINQADIRRAGENAANLLLFR